MFFRFANPEWSHLMWALLAWLAVLIWLERRRQDVLQQFVSTTMQTKLVHRLPARRRWLSLISWALMGVCTIIALMRPQWGLEYVESRRAGAQIMVCLDVSKSMLAEDAAPNRLDRAKAELTDLLTYSNGDQIGLIAFAGRATVMCPLTSDFGFFRLVLNETGPHSVGRGGTRLEEPIRKALDGFRSESDVSRLLVLITDGEDHDSHPLDAAKAAAERGVRILTIGFGDEAGSEIFVTDPATGARAAVRDQDSQPVISRLDGQTLREIALATDGAYVPAGTGALDLKSIYDAHIAPLVRGQMDQRGQAVRRDLFQWALLAALSCLIAAVGLRSGSVEIGLPAATSLAVAKSKRFKTVTASLVAAIGLQSLNPIQLQAQPATNPSGGTPVPESTVVADGVSEDLDTTSSKTNANQRPTPDPRSLYNEALAYLDSDLERATRHLEQARREAATDGAVRFRSTYNLGWVAVKRADQVITESPREALDHLRRAADWFRDATRLRPDDRRARHNLEIVLRRILELSDALAKQEKRDLAQRLDALVLAQRELVGASRQIVDQVTAQSDANAADQFRHDFRQLAIRQRQQLAECQALTADASAELETLSNKSEEEQTPDEKIRAAQLAGVLHYANRASQRLGQARSQMRRRQAQRAFRRAAAGLTELKRARDQLRGPVEVLDVILADAVSLTQATTVKANESLIGPGDVAASNTPPANNTGPSFRWLTGEYLDQQQQSLMQRTTELTTRLLAALTADADPADPADQQQQLDMVRDAEPFLVAGKESMTSAAEAIATTDYGQAVEDQLAAIVALRNARERFLDLRGLIELTYARQRELVQRIVPNTDSATDDAGQSETDLTADEASDAQVTNLERADRIAKMIDQNLAKLSAAPSTQPDPKANASPDPQEAAQAERQRLELAKLLVDQARSEMLLSQKSVTSWIDSTEDEAADADSTEAPRTVTRRHAKLASEHLQSLRRLFFSIVEHLRETAQRQAELNDETEQFAGQEIDGDPSTSIGPLNVRQQELQTIATQLAEALQQQATENSPGQDDLDPQHAEQLQQAAGQLREAAGLVEKGAAEMTQAVTALTKAADRVQLNRDDEPPPDEDDDDVQLITRPSNVADDAHTVEQPLVLARQHQNNALHQLIEALTRLEPTSPQDQNQNQSPADNQNQDEQQQDPSQPQPEDRPSQLDPSRLLQAIRDREAQRRRDRAQRQSINREPVDKDW